MNKKSVIITGAAHGIGEALVQKFIENGYFVGMIDIDHEKLSTIGSKLNNENILYKKVDITKKTELESFLKDFSNCTGGRLDLLCANAGIIKQGSFEEFNASDYSKLINVNTTGTTLTIMSALKLLKDTPSSKVIITSSASAMFGIPTFAVYSSTKAYLKNLTEALSSEFSKYDIKVSSVMPNFVKTNMTNDIDEKHTPDLTPEEISNLIYNASKKMRKRHYLVGKNIKLMGFMQKILPVKIFQEMIYKMIYK